MKITNNIPYVRIDSVSPGKIVSINGNFYLKMVPTHDRSAKTSVHVVDLVKNVSIFFNLEEMCSVYDGELTLSPSASA